MRQFILTTALVLLSSVPADAQEDCAAWGTRSFFSTGTAEQVTSCLESGADVNAVGESGATPLHLAARWARDPAVIAVLVDTGADVNARDSSGETPLRSAVLADRMPAVEALLAAGADPAARRNRVPAVEALLAGGADVNQRDPGGQTPLHTAAARNRDTATVVALVTAGTPGCRGAGPRCTKRRPGTPIRRFWLRSWRLEPM